MKNRILINEKLSYMMVSGYLVRGTEYIEVQQLFKLSEFSNNEEIKAKFKEAAEKYMNDEKYWSEAKFIKPKPINELNLED